MRVVGINLYSRLTEVSDSLFAFPKGFLINLTLAPGALKTLRRSRIRQLKSSLFHSPKIYEQKTFEGTLKGVCATCF